jgi:hypothetical protein
MLAVDASLLTDGGSTVQNLPRESGKPAFERGQVGRVCESRVNNI